MTAATTTRPETKAQAERFETVKNLAHELGGLCHGCAVQFSYGTQHGFSAGTEPHKGITPPCNACTLTMARWPLPEAQGWRRPGRGSAHHRETWAHSGKASVRPEARPAPGEPTQTLAGSEPVLVGEVAA